MVYWRQKHFPPSFSTNKGCKVSTESAEDPKYLTDSFKVPETGCKKSRCIVAWQGMFSDERTYEAFIKVATRIRIGIPNICVWLANIYSRIMYFRKQTS